MDFLTKPILSFMIIIYSILANNFGLAIIALTFLMFLITLPLTIKQQRSMKKMQEQQQKLQQDKRYKKIMEKYKDNKRKQQEEILSLQSELGINPLSSLSGCLFSLVQIPIWIGLFGAIKIALGSTPVELLSLAEKLKWAEILHLTIPSSLIPLNSQFLWLTDLSQPERLLLPFLSGIPLLSFFAEPGNGLPVLTILVVITTWLQTKLQPTAAPADGQGAQMSQSMGLMMPLMMGFISYSASAGLALYFVVSSLMRLPLSIVMRQKNEQKPVERNSSKKSKT